MAKVTTTTITVLDNGGSPLRADDIGRFYRDHIDDLPNGLTGVNEFRNVESGAITRLEHRREEKVTC